MHELHDIPDLHYKQASTPLLMAKCAPPDHPSEWGEQPGGRDVPPSPTAQASAATAAATSTTSTSTATSTCRRRSTG